MGGHSGVSVVIDIGGDSRYMRLEIEVAEAVYRHLLLDYDSLIVNPP